jgi:hypothetical protein
MARKPAWAWTRSGLAVAAWAVAIGLTQVTAGADIGRKTRELEEQLELRLKGTMPPAEAQPQRSHEDESFESWELVDV